MRHSFPLAFVFTLPSHRCLAVVDIECSVAAPCPGMNFENFNIAVENGTAPTYTCINVVSETGLPGKHCSPHETFVRITGWVGGADEPVLYRLQGGRKCLTSNA